MNDAMVRTSGTEFVGRTFGGAGGVGGGGADVEAPNIGGGNARGGNVAATFGIRPGFDAKQQWITAKKKVQEFVVEQFKSGPAFFQIVKSNFREAVLSRPELYLEASFEVFLVYHVHLEPRRPFRIEGRQPHQRHLRLQQVYVILV